jgi:hypothetical protein
MTCLTNGDDFAVIVAAREKYVKMQHRLAVLRFRMAAFCQLHVFPTNATAQLPALCWWGIPFPLDYAF